MAVDYQLLFFRVVHPVFDLLESLHGAVGFPFRLRVIPNCYKPAELFSYQIVVVLGRSYRHIS